jgi:alpha-galactosidase
MQRRKFIRTITTGSTTAWLTGSLFSACPALQGAEVSNDFFKVRVREDGTFDVLRTNGEPFVTGATAGANTSLGKLLLDSGRYEFRTDTRPVSTPAGRAKQLHWLATDRERLLDIELHLTLYDRYQQVTVEAFCKNVSGNEIRVASIEPIRVTRPEQAALHIPDASRCLTNGAMYYDAGLLHEFGTPFERETPYGETKGGKLINPPFPSPGETVRSWWNTGIFSGYDREGVALGYLGNKISLGQLLLSRTSGGRLAFLAESVLNPGFTLLPGQTVSSDLFMLNIAPSPYEALENYAENMALHLGGRHGGSLINGWCSWFYTYANVTEEEVVRNAEYAGRYLKPYGLEYIQIDEGYQRWHGDWEGNERFPNGMKWLAEKIKSFGLKPGLWIAPYVVSEPVDIFQNNPDWFFKNSDGSPMRVGPWPDIETDWAGSETPKRYGLDISHPDAARWFHQLFETISKDWGYDMVKIDFVAWSILSAPFFYDKTQSATSLYRKGYEIMRAAVKPDCHLLECGPGNVTTGLIDSMRIEYDQNYENAENTWKQYFLHPSSSGPAMAKRYYFHQKTWLNDADHVCINLLSLSKSKAVATLLAMSGGNLISGDRLIDLDGKKMEILKKTFPAYTQAAKPVDLFDTNLSSAFALRVKKPFGDYTLASFFNSHETEPLARTFPLRRLWLAPEKTYLVWDFWKNQFLGEISGEISVRTEPASVTHLAIHEKRDAPQFLSSSRHILQGAVEVENFAWDESKQTLSGTSVAPAGTKNSVSVFLPARYFKNDPTKTTLNYGRWQAAVEGQILKVHLDFADAERLEWTVRRLDFR